MKRISGLFAMVITAIIVMAAPARADDEVDVRDLVAVADERLADHHAIDLCHGLLVSLRHFTDDTDTGPNGQR